MSHEEIDVRYVADLARVELTDEEAATYQKQLGDILEYVTQLQEVDVSGVDALNAGPIQNNLRPDVAEPGLGADTILSLAPKASNDLVVVPKVVE